MKDEECLWELIFSVMSYRHDGCILEKCEKCPTKKECKQTRNQLKAQIKKMDIAEEFMATMKETENSKIQ